MQRARPLREAAPDLAAALEAHQRLEARIHTMPNDSPRAQRLAQIDIMRTQANELSSSSLHDTMKTYAALAIRDLNEATVFLNEKDIDNRPYILAMADLAIGSAASRISLIGDAVAKYGPGVRTIG
jgi:hypothetical protein